METSLLLERYRNDRRKLLDFLLSSNLIKQVESSSTSNSIKSIDSISVDYVLNCINSGQSVNLSEASRKYIDESIYPLTIESSSGSHYFLCSDPNLSGSPPGRVPPKVDTEMASSSFYSSNQLDHLVTEDIAYSVGDDSYRCTNEADEPCQPVDEADLLSFGLPTLSTELSEDDLREVAYEVLLGCMAFSGFEIYSFEEKKKENKSTFLSRLKSKREKINSQPLETDNHFNLLNNIRSQMQISEAIDTCIRRRLMPIASTTSCIHIDVPHILLELLNSIGRYDFPNEKLYIQWRKRQVTVLEEVLHCSCDLMTDEHIRLRSFIEMVRNDERDTGKSTSELARALLAIKKFSSKLSSIPGKFGLPGETYYWTTAYHLNINLYEQLLCSLFDILDEGQLIQEVDEFLMVIRMSWTTLGINQKMHEALYGWVLFRKFVETGETDLLDYAILTIQKIQTRDDDVKQEAYMNSLICSRGINGKTVSLDLLDAIFLSIGMWCHKKLIDYHLHFGQKAIGFEKLLTLYILVGMISSEENGALRLIKLNASAEVASKHLKACIEDSIQATCRRLNQVIDVRNINPKSEGKHPMAKLADELILVAEKESNMFSPVLSLWYPRAGMISSLLLHKFYGKKLKPFLDGVTCLSDDVRSVLPAAERLDQSLSRLYYCEGYEDNSLSDFSRYLDHYQIGEVCKPLILDWINGKHLHILEWTERALDLEDWEILSFRQRHAASIVEVFRILEETVDQLFDLKLPLDVMHLQSLISIIFQSLNTYMLKMAAELVEKSHLFPAAPALTRYKETVIPTIKKKSVNCKVLEENILTKLKKLTVPKLCVRINTLQYIQNKLGIIENDIRESWALLRTSPVERFAKGKLSETLPNGSSKCSESIDGLFSTFNKIRKNAGGAINTIRDFIGTRVVFWDLRDSFLFKLYRGEVENARLESCLPHFDTVLDQICAVITDSLRDLVVERICQASMEGYIWVLLEGGPSRAFEEKDVMLMQEDLQILKDFFVADGEGLPTAVVEQKAVLAQNIIYMYTLQSETLIEKLMLASHQVSIKLDSKNPGDSCGEDAHTLLRVLCHKKDRDASKFLKRQYQLPESSEYEESSTVSSPLIPDLLKRSKSAHWGKKSEISFRSLTKKFHEATTEFRHGGI